MPVLTPIAQTLSPEEHEETYVHTVYNTIAPHFSQTRYKPWPLIATFLASLQPGSIGLDSGTGNGKYLPINQDGKLYTVGLDRSSKLLEIAKSAGGEHRDVVLGDALGLGWRRGAFDYAISIATIHHLSTLERRRLAVEALLHALSPKHGRLLLYVWAIEQDDASKRVVPTLDSHSTSPGEAEGDMAEEKAQDVLVPWVLPTQSSAAGEATSPAKRKSREKARKQATDEPQAPTSTEPEVASETMLDPPPHSTDVPSPNQIYQRYYHFFAPGELSSLTLSAARSLNLSVGPPPAPESYPTARGTLVREGVERGIEVVNQGWERSNYYLEARLWEVVVNGSSS
ncbi:hypothetical protein BOTBODRAFT_51154 [Botryobasidium botryosum FD-172 SS1]|uniref:Methyltransferase type 11 domain-containing protein n=1 Tax=Botryobasidium botryosum (strain FD-172 SS1) TaxID=930990 RepID=A0A067MVV2_BOTB1|nr:hypothetical protein BOTBODRAFT_51154 [Botryobasidium botryosum FD-172 SS1]